MPLSLRTVVLSAAAALAVAGAVQACSLNPQPLPPGYSGDNTEAGSEVAADASVAADGALFGGGADAGAGADSALPGTPNVDGGASDTADGAADAAGDAPNDAPTDSPTDGGSE